MEIEVNAGITIAHINGSFHQDEPVCWEQDGKIVCFQPDQNLSGMGFKTPGDYKISGVYFESDKSKTQQRATLVITAQGWRETEACKLILTED